MGTQNYIARFSISGTIGKVIVTETAGAVFEVKRGVFLQPITAGAYHFYLYIADIGVEDIVFSLARRKLTTVDMSVVIMEPGSIFVDEPTPEPILTRRAELN